MRLLSYRSGGQQRLGARADGAIVDLNAVDPAVPTDVVALLEGGDAAMAAARAALDAGRDNPAHHAPADAQLLPVVPRPPKIVCVARNYAEHAAEAKLDILSEPNLFIRFAQSLIADGDPIQVPRVSKACDWEAELAVVIGRGGRHISKADALDHVAGYSIFNDVSIRDWQIKKPPIQFGAGKNFDGSGPFGPDLVGGDQVRAERARGVEVLAGAELDRRLGQLPVADRDV
ncbi:MAG: hypothetical protein QOG77_5, partial [Solirubrobacteraceae bacterium]|nr:hypothetical protein [Solirubrobacteraceae bacterium]